MCSSDLAIVPAVTAGAICQDKMRGGLALMMVTDLSDAEIVLGRLASRLVTVLGVIFCGLPVLAILTSLGGVDPVDVVTGTMVIIGVSVLCVCLAMTFSVWAASAHEALMATYAAFAVWFLAFFAWTELRRGAGPAADLLQFGNPVWLLLAGERQPAVRSPAVRLGFLIASLIISAVLTSLAIWKIRTVTLRQNNTPARRRRPARLGALNRCLHGFGSPAATIEGSPVLWRELHHRPPTRWGQAIWRLYGVSSVFFAYASVFINPNIAPGTLAFIVSIGLLLVGVHSATVLAEERSHGSLDVLLATPLSSRSIVLGKWWGAFHPVPRLAVLAGLIAFGAAVGRSLFVAALAYSVLTTALVLAFGAFFTSLGLAIATWQPRIDRAVGFSVGAFLFLTIVYPALVISTSRTGPDDVLLLWVSPFFGMYLPMGWICWSSGMLFGGAFAMFFWTLFTAVAAGAIQQATENSFDRLIGRVSEAPERAQSTRNPRTIQPQSRASSGRN